MPISYTKSSKKLFGIVIGVVVLLLGAGFYAAADAGFIGSGDMPIDFIANNKATDKQSDSVEADPANAEPVSGRTPSDSTPVDNPDQPVSSSINEADEERLTDIKAIHGQLEMYYAKNKRYPTLAEINDASFRSQHLLGMVDEALKDPEGSEARLVAEPGAKAYAYEATTMSGEQCDNATAVCLQYTLTATLSDGKKQTHKQLD